jgi:hypothetical protein
MSKLLVQEHVRPRTLLIAAAVINVANELGWTKDMVITSGNDSGHSKLSWHYEGRALDIRTHHLTLPQKTALINALRAKLGPNYDIILESLGLANEHLHLEYQPR